MGTSHKTSAVRDDADVLVFRYGVGRYLRLIILPLVMVGVFWFLSAAVDSTRSRLEVVLCGSILLGGLFLVPFLALDRELREPYSFTVNGSILTATSRAGTREYPLATLTTSDFRPASFVEATLSGKTVHAGPISFTVFSHIHRYRTLVSLIESAGEHRGNQSTPN